MNHSGLSCMIQQEISDKIGLKRNRISQIVSKFKDARAKRK